MVHRGERREIEGMKDCGRRGRGEVCEEWGGGGGEGGERGVRGGNEEAGEERHERVKKGGGWENMWEG